MDNFDKLYNQFQIDIIIVLILFVMYKIEEIMIFKFIWGFGMTILFILAVLEFLISLIPNKTKGGKFKDG